jgi:hypothetical protein
MFKNTKYNLNGVSCYQILQVLPKLPKKYEGIYRHLMPIETDGSIINYIRGLNAKINKQGSQVLLLFKFEVKFIIVLYGSV